MRCFQDFLWEMNGSSVLNLDNSGKCVRFFSQLTAHESASSISVTNIILYLI